MTSVPAAAVSVWCAAHPAHRAVLEPALVLVGDRPEVDLEVVAGADAQVAAQVAAWWEQTRALWAAAASDRLAGHPWVRTRRTLTDVAQVTGKKDKRDLGEEFAALTEAGPYARLVIEASAPVPQTRTVRAMARALGGSFTVTDAGAAATLRVPLTGTMWWPNAIGGPAWPGEVARELVVGFRYAAWRDRRVRRLASVQVTVDELWADPQRVPLTGLGTAPGRTAGGRTTGPRPA